MKDEQVKFSERLAMIKNYNNVLDDIKKYNRADTVNMSEEEMNKFRHIAGPAYLTSKYYAPEFTNILGMGKEALDFVRGRGLEDIKQDYANNQIGIEIGLANRNINGTQKDLFNYIFKEHIEPYRNKNAKI